MSVYRTLDEGPVSEFSTQRVAFKRKRPAGSGGPHSSAQDQRKRKAAPVSEPLPVTFRWIARLPQTVQPLALLRRFPRIANALATSWPDPPAFRTCLYDLLTDSRGNRRGFPQEVLAELLALRVYFEERPPSSGSARRR